MNALTIRELPRSDRPRERLVDLGVNALSTAELLAIVLGSGGRGRSALRIGAGDPGRRRTGRSAAWPRRPVRELTALAGVGRARAAVIHAVARAGPTHGVRDPRGSDPHPVARGTSWPRSPRGWRTCRWRSSTSRSSTRSTGWSATSRSRVVFLNSSLVHPREVFREAIAERAAAIILVHNHPSGDPTPSADDRNVTDQLVAAGRLLDIPVHDHVIIGRGRYTSFAEAGLL